MASTYDNSLVQLEASWGKPRASWTVDDWQCAATALERNRDAVASELVARQGDVFADLLLRISLLVNPPKRKIGRPAKAKQKFLSSG